MTKILKSLKCEIPVVVNLSVHGLSRTNLFLAIKTYLSTIKNEKVASVPMGRWATDTKSQTIKDKSRFYY